VQPNSSIPFRTYQFTYLTDPNYTSRYIRNRLTAATVNGITLTTKSYDTTTIGPLVDPTQSNGPNQPSGQPTPILHDTAYGASFTYRGNTTISWHYGTAGAYAYDMTGVPYAARDGAGMSVSIATDSFTGYPLPSVMSPNSNGNLAPAWVMTARRSR
jgi:hypothetical protein